MAYTVKAEGANAFELTEETVQSVKFLNTSSGNSDARARDTYQTLEVGGRIRSAADGDVKDSTLKASKWALVPAIQPAAYQKITAVASAAGQITRQYELSQAFVVGYSETFSDQSGVGTFSLKVRQKKDQLDQVKVSGWYAAQ